MRLSAAARARVYMRPAESLISVHIYMHFYSSPTPAAYAWRGLTPNFLITSPNTKKPVLKALKL